MLVPQNIIETITHFHNASGDDIITLKDFFMPDDNKDDIKMKVRSYPDVDERGNVFIKTYEITVFLKDVNICDIHVDPRRREAYYMFFEFA